MDAAELARWTRFAGKGGIGICTAVRDCVAERVEDLMFLNVTVFPSPRPPTPTLISSLPTQDDVITVLMQIPDLDDVFLV
jgi:hypothetical protein